MNEINQAHSNNTLSLLKTDQVAKPSEILKPSSTEAKAHELTLLESDKASVERGSDRVEVSAAGAALAEASAREAAALEATIRIEKVAKIRSDIQNGIYDIDGRLGYIVDDLIDDITNS